MKLCVILVLVVSFVAVIYGDEEAERKIMEEADDKCQKDPSTSITNELRQKLSKGEEVDKSKMGAYSLCMSTNLNLMDRQGKMIKENIKSALSHGISDEAKLNEAVEKCSHERDDAQETSLAMWRCFRELSPTSKVWLN